MSSLTLSDVIGMATFPPLFLGVTTATSYPTAVAIQVARDFVPNLNIYPGYAFVFLALAGSVSLAVDFVFRNVVLQNCVPAEIYQQNETAFNTLSLGVSLISGGLISAVAVSLIWFPVGIEQFLLMSLIHAVIMVVSSVVVLVGGGAIVLCACR